MLIMFVLIVYGIYNRWEYVVDILCVISRWIIMCNIYVNYNRKPNKYFLLRWIRWTGNTCFVVIASLHCYMARAFSSKGIKLSLRCHKEHTNSLFMQWIVPLLCKLINTSLTHLRHLWARLTMLFKIQLNLVAVPMPSVISVPVRSTPRHPHDFQHMYTSTNSYKYSFFIHTVHQWNLLPPSIASMASLSSFKAAMDSYSP